MKRNVRVARLDAVHEKMKEPRPPHLFNTNRFPSGFGGQIMPGGNLFNLCVSFRLCLGPSQNQECVSFWVLGPT